MYLNLFLHRIRAVECKDLDEWLFNCDFLRGGAVPQSVPCNSSGWYEYKCTPREGVVCNNTEVIRTVRCIPTTKYNKNVALLLSIFLGIFGVDRFYLGYYTLGAMKLITGGLYSLGWYIDIFSIALGVVTPARGNEYTYYPGAPIVLRLPIKDFAL